MFAHNCVIDTFGFLLQVYRTIIALYIVYIRPQYANKHLKLSNLNNTPDPDVGF